MRMLRKSLFVRGAMTMAGSGALILGVITAAPGLASASPLPCGSVVTSSVTLTGKLFSPSSPAAGPAATHTHTHTHKHHDQRDVTSQPPMTVLPDGIDPSARQGLQRMDGNDHRDPVAGVEDRCGDRRHGLRLTRAVVIGQEADRGEFRQ